MNDLLNAFINVSTADWIVAFAGISSIIVLLLGVEYAIQHLNINKIFTRKFIHISTGLIIVVVSVLSLSKFPITLFAFIYLFVDLWALKKGKFQSIHQDKKSLGTSYYAISIFLLAILFWDQYKPIFIITNLIMIIPDAFAAIIGVQFAKNYFIPIKEKKSAIGAMTMFLLTLIIVFITLQIYYSFSIDTIIIITLSISMLATAAELLSAYGSDNLSVPFISALFIYIFIQNPDSSFHLQIFAGIIMSGFLAYISYRYKFLNPGGAIGAFIMGAIVFGLGGFPYTVPILIFFLSSSFLSLTGKKRKKMIEESYQKSGTRDFFQVFANGGVATVILVFSFFLDSHSLYPIYLVAIAAATADTWGTELGIYSKKEPLLITSMTPVEAGTSGAVSLFGSISSLIGSSAIAFSGLFFYNMDLYLIGMIAIFGYFGSIIDSILGSSIQAQYKCSVCNRITERRIHCMKTTNWLKGHPNVDNDIVNIFSILLASIISLIIFRTF